LHVVGILTIEIISQIRCFVMWYVNVIFIKYITFTTYAIVSFSRFNVLIICYGTAVEHRSLLNRSGICDGTNCCNIFFVHTAVLSIKTAFNLVKIHLLFRIIPLIQ
jgi:hypothetical protein